jgi:tRNA-uridine 2-sulfurtransferase
MQKKVLVAVSGGVDSAVTAALLKKQGFDVTAVFLCMRQDPGLDADAKQVADALNIKFISLPIWTEFESIIKNFIGEYEKGRTPNPCVNCNEQIKFGKLFALADSTGAQYLATGHYARIVDYKGCPAIAPALAPGKDQSYVLYRIPCEKLGRIIFPLGESKNKQTVRDIAKELGLKVHDKHDSQDVCFVPDGDYAKILLTHNSKALQSGNFINPAGKIIGKHDGYGRFTIGQRRGTGVAAGHPVYVTDINPQTAEVTIGEKKDLLASGLIADGANWQADVPAEFEAKVKIRYNHRGAVGRVIITGKDTFEVRFDNPVEAVTPGQAAVVYSADCLLGGGCIKEKIK